MMTVRHANVFIRNLLGIIMSPPVLRMVSDTFHTDDITAIILLEVITMFHDNPYTNIGT